MRFFLIFSLLISTSLGQENFEIKETVNTFTEKQVRRILTAEFVSRLEKFKRLQKKPEEYYDSLGLTQSEKKLLFKIFPNIEKDELPKMTISKAGEVRLTYQGEVAHFTLNDLAKRQVYIENKLVALPDRDFNNFIDYYSQFNKNIYIAFSKKTSAFNIVKRILLIEDVHAQEVDYLDLPDGQEVPQYHREGWDRKDSVDNLYQDMENEIKERFGYDSYSEIRHNIKQTKQVLLASIMAIAGDLELHQVANYEDKKINLPANLKKLYNHIDKLANMCDKERVETSGKFRNGSEATKMLTALDLTNEKINRLHSMGKVWWKEVDRLVWRRTSFHFDPDAKSYNICLVERIKKMYHDPKLCSNMEKMTKCLIDFRTSGRVSDKYLTDDQMDLLLDHPLGRDHGQDDILNWIQEK